MVMSHSQLQQWLPEHHKQGLVTRLIYIHTMLQAPYNCQFNFWMHFGILDAPAVQLFIHAHDNQQQPTRSLQKHVYYHKSKLCHSQDKIDQQDRIELP